MGNTGSYTAKAYICSSLYVFTTWGAVEMLELFQRSQQELAETFALKQSEFDFLLGREMVNVLALRDLFQGIFNNGKGSADKFEVMCVVCLASSMSNTQKVEFMFDMFNFNNKGFLLASEISLLLQSVTNGAVKADSTLTPPSQKTINKFVDHALHEFARFDSLSLRKPELIRYAAETKELQSFLEMWRGHASQVLLAKDEKWRDLSFPATITCITPGPDWLTVGLPPSNFVRWRRRENVGNGCNNLFTHILSILKTVDKRKEYTGRGLLGNGIIRRGILADKWFLNAVASVISKPEVLLSLFAATGQEHLGRYCVRMFEGGAWRSMFFDDRIPCGPDGSALFSCSSDSDEAALLVLQKGYAKYLGSYGHMAMCGNRHDSTAMGLRLMTGGHVQKLYTSDYDWKSMSVDVVGKDGCQLLQSIHLEGSIVSFGRSETLAYDRSTIRLNPRTNPPHGYLFPVVGLEAIDGFKYFICKDSWGMTNLDLIYPDTVTPDKKTGYCRTFRLRAEDVRNHFDTVFVSRFPDVLRPIAQKMGFKPWKTNVISHTTKGTIDPARFVMTVTDQEVDWDIVDEDADAKRMTLKGLMTASNKFHNVAAPAANTRVKVQARPAANVDQQRPSALSGNSNGRLTADELVDICFTISSNCEWAVAGGERAQAKVRVCIVPSQKTRRHIRVREVLAEEQRRKDYVILQSRLALAESLKDKSINVTHSNSESSTAHDVLIVEQAGVVRKTDTDEVIPVEPILPSAMIQEKDVTLLHPGEEPHLHKKFVIRPFEIRLSASQSWLSHSVKLWPGKYYLFADVSYEPTISFASMLLATIPAVPSQAPWQEFRHPSDHKLWLQLSTTKHVKLTTATAEDIPKNNIDLNEIIVEDDSWPFVMESQGDAASKGLINMTTDLKKETLLLHSELVAVKFELDRMLS